ncbi:hypothetical protein [Arthrobacter sp. Ld5]|uniref:hypothetical protein n=1 Tax=Arthrobacter sp. Ld5 TaxID=649152 RepID=UPI003EB73643
MIPQPRPVPATDTDTADNPILHIQREQGADLFWRAALVLAVFLIAAIVVTLIGVPVMLMVRFWNPWLLFTLVFVAAGILLLVKTVAGLRTMAWQSRHRSSFVLRDTCIETTEWNTVGAEAPVRRVIPMGAIASVVASHRIVRRVMRTRIGGGVITETAPILHILFDQDGRRQISSVPFPSHKDPGVDTWIDELRRRDVRLGYTARLLSWKEEDYLSDEARLGYFATTDEVLDYPATGGWLENAAGLGDRWRRNAEEIQEQAERRDPGLRQKRLRPTGRSWLQGAWLAVMYATGAGFLLPYLVEDGLLPLAAWPLQLLVVLPAAGLFFLPLRRGLRWYHVAVCWLLLVVTAFTVVVGVEGLGRAAEDMALIGFGLTVLSAGLLWAPYLLVKRSVTP